MRASPRRHGFTLIETAIVAAIIALLMGILFSVGAAARESANQNACMDNLRQLGAAIAMYQADWGGATPVDSLPLTSVNLYPDYAPNRNLWLCPDDYKRLPIEWWGGPISYIYGAIRGSEVPGDTDVDTKWRVYQRRGNQMPILICPWHVRPHEKYAWEQPLQTWIVLRLDGSVSKRMAPGLVYYSDL